MAQHAASRKGQRQSCRIEALEDRRLLSTVTLDASTSYQTIQGWGSAPLYPDGLTIAQVGNVMRDAGLNTVRVTAGPGEFTYTTGGSMSTPVPISSDLNANVAKFGGDGMTKETDLIKWLEVNGLDPERTKMIGSLWSPPAWMKISTGTLMTWDDNGTQRSAYDPILPWGDYGGNTGGGRVNPTMWTDWARYVLSDVKAWEQKAGIPMYAFSFQNEPDVQVTYNSAFFNRVAVDPNDPSKGTTTGQWQLYGDALQALATELSAHPEVTTKFFGPELEALGPAASNPWFLSQYYTIRQNLIDRGLLGVLGGYATHQYQYAKDGDAAVWDAFYNGSAHTAQILSNGTSNVLGWLWPNNSTVGVAGDNKEIWQTETEGEDQTWTKDGALGFGLKIFDSVVYGHASGYTTWNLISYNPGDAWGLVDVANISNPTASYKFDAMKQFSRWIRPGAQRIEAVFENGKSSIGGANELDTYNGLNVAAFNHPTDKRLTMVMVNMKSTSDTTTFTIPAGMNISSFQVYETSGTEKYVRLADVKPVNGKITITVPGSAIVTVTGSYAQVLPSPWTSNDIGMPNLAGWSAYDSTTGTYTLAGSGSDIWNNSDQFQFASQNFSGNGSIIARVNSVQNTNSWAKAGVMFRDSTAADAAFADVVVTPSSGVSFQWRGSNGGFADFAAVGGISAPTWVKLVRNGSSFSGYYATTAGAPTAADWIQIGAAQSVTMSTAAQVGLAVTSHNSGSLSTATFTGVQLNQAPTVANAASSQANPVTGKSTTLSVLGADDNGEGNLAYTWSTTGAPPAAVGFGINGSNAAKSTVATFSKAGSYSFLVTITDAAGLSTTSSVNVVVSQTLAGLVISPSSGGSLSSGATVQFSATGVDQFGAAMNASPTWSATGGNITANGLYTAGATAGSYAVTATSGAVKASVPVTVVSPSLFSGQTDFGNAVNKPGSYSLASNVYTVSGAGSDIYGSSDNFHFVYRLLAGDGEIVTRVAGLQNTNSWAKAGVMFRDGLAANARNAFIAITPGHGVTFQARTATGGSTSSSQKSGLVTPYWLKLVRSGNVFQAFYSANGTSWTQLGSSQTITMGSSVYVGLAVTSHNSTALCTATFDNVSIQPYSNLAAGKTATASTTAAGFSPLNAIDSNNSTAWTSAAAGSQSITVDLGVSRSVSHVQIGWGASYAKSYSIQVSSNNSTWTTIYSTTSGAGATVDVAGLLVTARYVRVSLISSNAANYQINEIAVQGK